MGFSSPYHFSSSQTRLIWLERLTALFALVLLWCSWPLWWGGTSFPMIPLLPGLSSIPLWIDRALLIGLILALAGWILLPASYSHRRIFNFAIPLLFLLLAILDQHRIQTWSYQFSLMGILLGCRQQGVPSNSEQIGYSADRALKLLQILIASIYIYSALSKLDLHFISGGGFFLSEGLMQALGIDTTLWSDEKRKIVTSLLPLYELTVGITLLFKRFRRIALVGSILLHLALLLTLGPWGLHHSDGVLIWNLYFIVQNLVLFSFSLPAISMDATEAAIEPSSNSVAFSPRKSLGYLTFVFAIAPSLGGVGVLRSLDWLGSVHLATGTISHTGRDIRRRTHPRGN
ncbi:MAG: hypothetical protein R3C11_02625 [Planctomycetaceae bacterium]